MLFILIFEVVFAMLCRNCVTMDAIFRANPFQCEDWSGTTRIISPSVEAIASSGNQVINRYDIFYRFEQMVIIRLIY